MRDTGMKRAALLSAGTACVLACGFVWAQGGGSAVKVTPLQVESTPGLSEADFAENYLEWLAHRAAIDHFDANYMRRIEEARFAASKYHAYLDERPFLAESAAKFARFLKDLDAVQDRVKRWKASGQSGAPAYKEAVAGYERKTIYGSGAELPAMALKTNYFAQRLKGGRFVDAAREGNDEAFAKAGYDLLIASLANVPPGERYDPYRIDVLRKAINAGRMQLLLRENMVEMGFQKSVKAEEALAIARAAQLLRKLSPSDPYGNIRAASAVGRWGAGDPMGAYEEVRPAANLRKTNAKFGIFCARLASAVGKTEDSIAWLSQAARVDLTQFPSVDVLMKNPDFAAVREKQRLEFLGLAARAKRVGTYSEIARIAKALVEKPGNLEMLKSLNELLPEMSSMSGEMHATATAMLILGLRANGRSAGVSAMQKQLLKLNPSSDLLARLSDTTLMDSCTSCNGQGIDLKKNQICRKCGGGKKCRFEYCVKGKRMSPFDKARIAKGIAKPEPCGDCRGTGICRYCKGKGKLPCGACDGGGKAISAVRVLAQFREVAEEAVTLAGTERTAFLKQSRLPSSR